MGENGGSQVKSGTWVNRMKPLHGSKRRNKPLVEKKRRARINESLAQLKTLVLESMQKNYTGQYSKLEKADILEMTVKHLVQLKQQVNDRDLVSKYQVGYNQCASEVVRYLGQSHNAGTETRNRLVNHLSQHTEPGQCSTTQPRHDNETQTQPRSGSYLMMLQTESNMAPVVTNNTIYVAEYTGASGNCYNTNIVQSIEDTNLSERVQESTMNTTTPEKANEQTQTCVQPESSTISNESNTITVQTSNPYYVTNMYSNIDPYVTNPVLQNTVYSSTASDTTENLDRKLETQWQKERQENRFIDTVTQHTYNNSYSMPLDNISRKETEPWSETISYLTNNETQLQNRDYNSRSIDHLAPTNYSRASSPKGQLPPFQVFRETLRQSSRCKKQDNIAHDQYKDKYPMKPFKRNRLGLVNGNHHSSTQNRTTVSNVEDSFSPPVDVNSSGGILGLGSSQVWRPW